MTTIHKRVSFTIEDEETRFIAEYHYSYSNRL